jgi:hypothetical protein
LADAVVLRETLQNLGSRMPQEADIEDWLASVDLLRGPPLIRAGQGARDWMNLPGIKENSLDSVFLAACICAAQASALSLYPSGPRLNCIIIA